MRAIGVTSDEDVDQTAMISRLVCAIVVCMQQNSFLFHRDQYNVCPTKLKQVFCFLMWFKLLASTLAWLAVGVALLVCIISFN